MPRSTKLAAPKAAAQPAASNYPVIRDKAAIAAADEYAKLKLQTGKAEARLKELKPVLEDAMGDAPIAYAGERILRRTEVAAIPATPNRQITRDMVGQVIEGKKGKAGYSQLSVT